jgi:hypothetical protein
MAVALLCGVVTPARASAPPPNAIQRENALPGSADWQRQAGGDIQVYGTQIAGGPGDAIDLHVSTAYRYRVVVYRLGWYGGAGARQEACLPSCTTDEQGVLQTTADGARLAADDPPIRAGWPVTDTVHTGPDWVSGYYLVEALLTNGPNSGRVATTFFVLHEAPQPVGSRILVQVPVNTWQAYNAWGGRSLYDFTAPPMHRVSFERPFGQFAQSPFWWEIQLVRFLEREGYDVSYQTDVDTDADPASLLRHRLVIDAGHDEYWTMAMRQGWGTALADGTNLAFMGSNDAYWHIEYEDNRQTIFGWKSAYDPNPVVSQKTMLWRDIGLPECMLEGVEHQGFAPLPHPLDYVVTPAGASDPWVAGTGLTAGTTIAGIVGREHDSFNPWPDSCVHPGLVDLFHYDGAGVDSSGDAVRFTAPSGARVFASGAQMFSWALDDWRSDGTIAPLVAVGSDRVAPVDPRVQQFMRNALADLQRPAPPAGLAAQKAGGRLVVSVAAPVDPRVIGFVAAVQTAAGWHRLCHGTTSCSGRMPAGAKVVGAIAFDQWHDRSAGTFVALQPQ